MLKTIKKNEFNGSKISNFSNEKNSPKLKSYVKLETFFTLFMNYTLLFSSLPFIVFVISVVFNFDFAFSFFETVPMLFGYLAAIYIIFLALSPMLISDLFTKHKFGDEFSLSSFQYKSVYERISWKRYLKSEEEYLYEEIIKNFTLKAKNPKNFKITKKRNLLSSESKNNYSFTVFFEKIKESFTVSFISAQGFIVEASKEDEIFLHYFDTKPKDLKNVASFFEKMKEQNEKERYENFHSNQSFTEEKEESIDLNGHKELFFDAISLKTKEMRNELSYHSNFSIMGKTFEIVVHENGAVLILFRSKTVVKTLLVDGSLQIGVNPKFLTLTDAEENYLISLFKDTLF